MSKTKNKAFENKADKPLSKILIKNKEKSQIKECNRNITINHRDILKNNGRWWATLCK